MNTDEFILLIYKNLKGELSPEEFTQLNILSAERPDWATIRMDIEDTWDLSGDSEIIANPESIDQAYSKLNSKITNKKNSPRIINLLLGLAASLVGIFTIVSLLKSDEKIFKSETGDKMFTLADNSKVWLREGSTLKIKEYSNSKRSVSLQGEAFFSVEKDKKRPYTVSTDDLEITVLGTQFLVKEKADSSITFVEVREGRVSVNNDEQERILSAGMMVKQRDGKFVPSPTLPNLSSWQDGTFEYNNTSILTAIKELSLIFNYPITIEEEYMKSCLVSGLVQGRDLKTILTRLSAQFKINVIETDGQYYLKGGQCD